MKTLWHFRLNKLLGLCWCVVLFLAATSLAQATTVTSINLASTNPTTAASPASWTVVFSSTVTGVDTTDFTLAQASGTTGASITSVSGSGTTWTVTANTGTSATGTLGLNLVDNDSIINATSTPLAGIGAGNGNFTGQIYTLVSPTPTLSKTASSSSAVIGDVVTFSITASNLFAVPLNDVVMTDTLPAGMTYVAQVATMGTVSIAGQVITWTVPSIPAASSAQLTLAISLSQQGTLINTVTSPGSTSKSAAILVLPTAATHFRLDEPVGSWSGAAGEVLDSGGTGLLGRRVTTSTSTTNTVLPSPTIASQNASVVGGFCNAGNFDSKAVVMVAANPLLQYKTKLSASAWIYPTAYPASDVYSILSNDINYEFHLNTSGKLYWWWGGSPRELTSNTKIQLNQWTHIAITMDSSAGREYIYINGVLDSNTNNWKGTLTDNPCNFYIGGDISTGPGCSLIPARNFRGMIDEVKLYTYELSAGEVKADMTLGRSCSGTFDHIQIEHDGNASVCAPEPVTIKACLDAACSTLYTGNVTVNLAPTGWVGGNTFTFSGGIAARQLSQATAGNVTLSTNSSSPTATNATRCFTGSTETCNLNFSAASCAFDAVEPGANPQTRIYTKLANAAFNIDVLALSASTTINTAYTGTAAVDLVDASSSGCPTGTGLNTSTNITFAAADKGRKQVSFNYPNATKNVRVRAKVGSSAPACSTDNFSIRPTSATLSTSATAAAPSISATPAIKAGTAFTIGAITSATDGYTGTLTLDSTKLTAQLPSSLTQQSGGIVGILTLSPVVQANASPSQSNNATWNEAGYLYAAAGALRDDSFTSVDANLPVGCNTASTCDCISDTSTTNYLSDTLVGSTGRYGCSVGNKTTKTFGRFIPHHFTVSSPTLTAACTVVSPFSYFGQDGFTTAFTLTAQNGTNGTTQNYSGNFAKLDLTSYTSYGFSTTTLPAGSNLSSSATAPIGSWINGIASVTAKHKISRPTAPTGETLITMSAAPTDGEVLSSTATALGSATRLRYGRIKLQNAYGSELLALPVPLEAQYWNGSSYVRNQLDSCTIIPASSIAMSSYTSNLNACETQIGYTSGTGLLSNGLSSLLRLTKPGTGNNGSVNLTLNLNSAAGNTCTSASTSAATSANLPWFGANPTSRETFGIYKTPIIYMRENF